MQLELVTTPALGDNSYVLWSGSEALVVDPQRDVRRFLEVLEPRGLSLRHVLETHLHNDYVSGALELREATGAEVVAPAEGGYGFPYRSVRDGDELSVGELRLVALATPGHTPEHLSYIVYEGDSETPLAVFTGGSLMVGAAGRTDLLGAGIAERLAREQYRSLRRLAALPDAVQVLPTHGSGSFCGAGSGGRDRASTIGTERARNPAVAAPDEEAFVRQQLSNLLAFPHYYAAMAPINRAGPRLLSELERPRPLAPDEFEGFVESGARAVDARWRIAFARAHVPGSLNVELADDFGAYIGWVLPFDAPVVMVLPEPEEEALEEARTQLLRIGYEHVLGYLAGGVEAWRASGRPVRSYPVAGLEEWCREWRAGRVRELLDVRQRVEWDRGHLEGSRHLFVGDLPDRLAEVPRDGEVWTVCATGHRAALAASLLDREEVPVRLVEGTGVEDFLRNCAGS